VNSPLAKQYDLSVREGAYIAAFAETSSAKEAGLKEGDVVTKIDNTTIRSNTALIEYIGRHRPGDKLQVTVNRKGKELTFPVVLKTREGTTNAIKPEERTGFASLGMELEDVDAKVLKNLDIDNGVRIKDLGNGKLARYTDIREGFIITKVNETPVKSVKEFNELLKKKKAGELVILSGRYENSLREYNYAFRM
jgi:S1-C subfamily serine protease